MIEYLQLVALMVIAAGVFKANSSNRRIEKMTTEEMKQLEALSLKIDAEIASKLQINEALANSQAALGVANAKIAELQAAAASTPVADPVKIAELQTALDAANAKIAELSNDADILAALQADQDKLAADLNPPAKS